MQIQGGQEAPKKLGEYLLTLIAAGRALQALYIVLSDLSDHAFIPPSAISDALHAGTRLPKITGYCMPTGDLFLFANEFTSEALRQLTALLATHTPTKLEADQISSVCHMYQLPDDAVSLRKLVKSYLVPGRSGGRPAGRDAGATSAPASGPGRPAEAAAAQPAALEGPLTLQLLEQINAQIDRIDVAQFINRQAVYRKSGEQWLINYVEYFFDIDRLKHNYFPRVDLHANESLFVEFVRNLDDLMLVHLLSERKAREQRIGLNLSISTVHSSTFQKFSAHLSPKERQNTVCELHWLDILQDIQDGGGAVRRLLDDGYAIAMDRVSLAVLPYLNLADIAFDHVKIRFDRQSLATIGQDIVVALRRCPPERIVFTACDDRRVIALGDKLGITRYQGRLIDQMLDKAA